MTIGDFNEIPIFDLSEANDPVKKPILSKNLRYILFNVGFLYISNTGVPELSL
jgi:isopenicillin N synthase-like dioxygenase